MVVPSVISDIEDIIYIFLICIFTFLFIFRISPVSGIFSVRDEICGLLLALHKLYTPPAIDFTETASLYKMVVKMYAQSSASNW